MHKMSAILFQLGQTVLTPGAQDALEKNGQSAREFLLRHARGDWGEVSEEDAIENDRAMVNGTRLLSAYSLIDGTKLWVITEGDGSVTTLLLPEEY